MDSRRNFLKQGALATSALLVAKPVSMVSNSIGKGFMPGNNQITLLHTNDLHDNLLPVTHERYAKMGGFQKTSELIASIRKRNANTLLVDAGDISCGDASHSEEHKNLLKGMQRAGYDAALLGNRDYAGGTDLLKEYWQQSGIPLVASNYNFRDSQLGSLQQPYRIVQKGNIKIGIIGAGINMRGLVPGEVNDAVQYRDPVRDLTAISTMLKQQYHCQLVVCLSHLGYKNEKAIDDLTLAAQSMDIDIIIGAHTHTFMAAPQIVLNKQQQEVIINHAGYGGIALGNISISFDDDGNKNGLQFNNMLVGARGNKWVPERASSKLQASFAG